MDRNIAESFIILHTADTFTSLSLILKASDILLILAVLNCGCTFCTCSISWDTAFIVGTVGFNTCLAVLQADIISNENTATIIILLFISCILFFIFVIYLLSFVLALCSMLNYQSDPPYHLFITSPCLFHVTDFLLLTSDYLLPTTNYLLLTSYFLLRNSHSLSHFSGNLFNNSRYFVVHNSFLNNIEYIGLM